MNLKFELHNKSIIFLLKSFDLGGAEKQALFLAGYLQNQRNCNVYVYSYLPADDRTVFDQECEKHQLRNLFVVPNPLSTGGKLKGLKKKIKLYQLGKDLKKHRPDLIIPYLNPPSIIASMIYKTAGAKTTFWHHRGVDYYRNDELEKRAAKKVPLLIANSESGVKELKEKLPIQRKHTHCLPNFSTISEIPKQNSDEIRKRLNIDLNSIVVGMVGHFRPEKLQKLLLEGCLDLFFEFPIHLVFVGNKGEEIEFTKIKDLISKHKLESRVTILHNTNSLGILPIFDIGVLLSEKEGMPNVVMEYMTYSLPVLTNAHSGCQMLLGEDYTFFTDNTVEDVKNKLTILVGGETTRETLGKRNQKRINEQFSIENYVEKLEKILSN